MAGMSSPGFRATAGMRITRRSTDNKDPRGTVPLPPPSAGPCWWRPARASTRMGSLAPTAAFPSARWRSSSLAWVASGISPISSRNTVPGPGMNENAGLVAVGPGEGPAAMAEQLILQQFVRESPHS